MSSTYFRVNEHIVPCQYLRQYPRSTSNNQEDVLHIHVKQYIPLNNPNPRHGDITLLAAHANGVPKELYEPLWDELLAKSETTHDFRIRSIWFADVSFQGQSYVLNEGKIGNDPAWVDHARDLLHLTNVMRDQMPRPIVGVGHSMGGQNIAQLALIHPRLFSALILIDPVLQQLSASGYSPAEASTRRRDVWPSREDAAAAFRRNKFYQSWDPRVLDRWIKYGLRELPTLVHPSYTPRDGKDTASSVTATGNTDTQPQTPVTLTTPKHQEVFTFVRPKYPPRRNTRVSDFNPPRKSHPDIIGNNASGMPFYRPEPVLTMFQLPHLRPKTCFVFARDSYLSTPELRQEKLDTTGVGYGGNGGHKEGGVKEVIVEDAGHFVPFEKPAEVAGEMVAFLDPAIQEWKRDEDAFEAMWRGFGPRERTTMSDDFVYWITPRKSDGKKKQGGREEYESEKAKL